MLKTEVLRKEAYYKEWREVSKGLSSSLDEYYENMVLLRNDTLNFVDIDSLFENSSFLKGYENVLKVQPN